MRRTALLALVLAMGLACQASAAAAAPSKALRDLVAKLGGDPAQAGSARYAYLNRLDGNLQALAAGEKPVTVNGVRLTGPAVVRNGRTLVDVYVNGDIDAAVRRLRALGMTVTAVSRQAPERMVEGLLPVDAAPKVAALSGTNAVLSGVQGYTDTGSVTSEGDASQRGPQARSLGPTGAGVKVGVMSDSMDQQGGGIAGSQGTGDLPAHVTDLGDAPGASDEGRAMAEIVYDEAPSITDMLFDTGVTGPATKANHIAALVSSGARVIADDTFYLTEPFFQDGIVAQAVDTAKAAGTAYLASAGNRANQSWDGTFVDGGGGLNDFGGSDTRQAVVDVPPGGDATFALQWDEPWGARTSNFNLIFHANNGPAFSCAPNATVFPIQECTAVNSGGSTVELELEIQRVSGTDSPRMKYIVRNNFGPFTIKDHATNQGAIDPDAASAAGSLSVAAVCWSTLSGNCFATPGLQAPEDFSSRGPAVRTRDVNGAPLPSPEVRAKPDVAGADGVSTDLPFGGGLNPFFGTSAAAPSVAGVAALALSANPAMTVDQLYALLKNPANSLDCTTAAGQPDTDCGAGFIQADRVVSQATTPPSVGAALNPAAPDGANGWYRSPVNVAWNVSDPNPSVLSSTGCGTATVSTDTAGTTFTCSATGVGGTKSASVTVKRDGTPPSTPSISGIAATVYARSHVPAGSSVHCAAADPTSGVDSCVVGGYSSALGSHKLTAVATNDAGETSTRTLTYRVAKTVCKVPKLAGKSLRAAKRALKRAHCRLGKVKKPKHSHGGLVVKSTSPRRGTVHVGGTKVKLTLKSKKR